MHRVHIKYYLFIYFYFRVKLYKIVIIIVYTICALYTLCVMYVIDGIKKNRTRKLFIVHASHELFNEHIFWANINIRYNHNIILLSKSINITIYRKKFQFLYYIIIYIVVWLVLRILCISILFMGNKLIIIISKFDLMLLSN